MPRTAFNFALPLLFVVAVVAFGMWDYGSPVSRKGLRELKITTTASGPRTIVSIGGSLISSSLAVSGIEQRRRGRCIVIIVKEGIIRRGRTSAYFHLDIPLTDDIDEVAFGRTSDVIWHRARDVNRGF